MLMSQPDSPGLQRIFYAAEANLDLLRVEEVLRRPIDQRFNEVLQPANQSSRGKPPVRRAGEEAIAKCLLDLRPDRSNQRASVQPGFLAPALFLSLQTAMKLHQDFMLKAALLSAIDLQFLPLLGAQAAYHKELERAGRIILEFTDGKLQIPAKKLLRLPRR